MTFSAQLRLGLVLTLAVAGCERDRRPPPSEASGAPAAKVVASAATAPAPAPGAAQAPAGDELAGTVVETMSSGGYTYAKIDRNGTEVWVAGPETMLAVGVRLGAMSGSLMTGFRSETLNRTFDEIYFVNALPVTGGASPNPHGAAAAAPTELIEKIAPAPGGQTVADVFASKDALAGKPVVVRGKVVKVNNGILGRNWLHLQDGTGTQGTNDLIVTTQATVAKGDVVVARGKLGTDKDFGAGYRYPVLVEDAEIAGE